MRISALIGTGIGTKKLAMSHLASPIMRPTPARDNFDNVTANVQVLKVADETVNNSAVLQNDDELFFNLDANSIYSVNGQFDIMRTATAGYQDGFTYPADAVCTQQVRITNYPCSNYYSVSVRFFLTTITAGTLQYQWAQLVAEASNTVVLAGSYLSYIKTPFQLI